MTESVPNRGDAPTGAQSEEQLQREIDEALGDQSIDQLMAAADEASQANEAAVAATAESSGENAGDGEASGDGPAVPHNLKRGRIVAVRGEDVFVELPGIGKTQGIVPLQQFERAPRVGSIMDFVVSRYDESEGLYMLSREGAVERASWDQMVRGSMVEARVTGSNKGGLELEMVGNIKAFMPASQVDIGHIEDLDTLIGQKLVALVQEVDRKGKQVVLSRRQFLERKRDQQKTKTLAEIEVDQVREGTISAVMDYGAFVDLGGIDGLIHVSDMSYSRVEKPSEVVKVGDKVMVKVLKIDTAAGRIGLGLKQTQPDPWDELAGTVKAGDQIAGRVTRTAPFGAFVEIKPGIEGLAPISELSYRRVNRVEEVMKVDDVKNFVVMDIDPGKRRISLSLKQAGGDPWVGAEHKFAVGSLIDGRVRSIKDFGAFIELEAGVEGLCHISELDHKRVNHVGDVLTEGETKQFRVIQIDEEGRKLSLSLKAVTESPEQKQAGQERKWAASQPTAKKKSRDDLKGGMGTNGALGSGLGDLKF